jgi:hypothetical protein
MNDEATIINGGGAGLGANRSDLGPVLAALGFNSSKRGETRRTAAENAENYFLVALPSITVVHLAPSGEIS